MIDEDGYILKEVLEVKRVKIPEDSVRCPTCHGTGKIRMRWSEPYGGHDCSSDFWSCWLCFGMGYLKKKDLESWQAHTNTSSPVYNQKSEHGEQ